MSDNYTVLFIIIVVVLVVYFIKNSEYRKTLVSKIEQLEKDALQTEKSKTDLTDALNSHKNSLAESEGKYKSTKEHLDVLITASNNMILQINDLQDQLKNMHGQVSSLALKQFDSFKQNEVELLKLSIHNSLVDASKVELASWKVQYEASIRQDAIMRSQAVNLGQITEHFIPFNKAFPYNPKEARFIGSPIDMIVFDGVDDGDIVKNVIFLEIKTSGSRMSKRQRLIRDAVEAGRVKFQELRM